MKIITIRIPTSYREWKNLIKERGASRKKHNQEVLWNFANAISREAQSNYWSKDISDTMITGVFRMAGNSKIVKLYFDAKNQLK